MSEALIHARGLTKRFDGRTAVDGIDVDVGRGEAFGFLGPNGAGKTSTMRMIGCVSPVTGGALRVLGFVQLAERADDRVDALSGGMRRRLVIARSLINEPEILLLDEPTTGLDPQARHLLWDRLVRLKQRGVTLVLTTHYMDEAEQLCDRLVVMDRGRIVAEGSPRALITRYVERDVVELRFAGGSDGHVEKLDGVGEHVEVLADRVLIGTSDGDATVEAVHARGVEPESLLVRRSTLEDVFLA